ncbi:class I SAM-dependent methyltransferase [Dokdonella sp.]|uniref:class I SAM-dependent methyltransferase n=1 Tax=Dokdonella sp. TaxID=2291710 RepID=UPI003C344080
MRRFETIRADFPILCSMLRGMPKSANQADSLAAFYAPQVDSYDRFRERLLQGREQLIAKIPLVEGTRLVDLGGGTGRNIEFFGDRASRIASYEVVDLCEPMLAQARRRAITYPQMHAVHGDATCWKPSQSADVVILSYALTMIPNWRAAIVNAVSMLKPGGMLGVVDFYVASEQPLPGCSHHSWFTRRFWPTWFGHDGVRLDSAQLPTLCTILPTCELTETCAAVPYLPLLRVPYYSFIGRKP